MDGPTVRSGALGAGENGKQMPPREPKRRPRKRRPGAGKMPSGPLSGADRRAMSMVTRAIKNRMREV